MDKSEIKGQRLITDVSGFKDENGLWKVTVLITSKRSFDGEEWESKSLSIMDIDEDFNRALLSCNFTIQNYLKAIDYDLFNEKADDQINDIKN